MSEHTFISPSMLPALALCPGRAMESRGKPDSGSPAAETGTRRHALFEWAVAHPEAPWSLTIPNPRAGESGELEVFQVLSEDVEAVKPVLEWYKSHPAHRDISGQVWVEENVEIGKWIGLPEGTFKGTVDLVLATHDTFEIADEKYGNTIVDPSSLQLKAYAVGAGSLLDWDLKHRQIRTAKLTILQPTAPVLARTAAFPVTAVNEWADEIKEIVLAAMDENAPRVPGNEQCHFCLARDTCRARLDWAAAEMKSVFGPIGTQESEPETPAPVASVKVIEEIADLRMTQDPESVTIEELGRLLDIAPQVRAFLDDQEKRAHKLLTKGVDVPGWKLVAGRNVRSWAVPDEEVEARLKKIGLKVTEIYERKLPSPAAAEAKVKVRGAKKMEMLEEIIHVKPGKPVLAPISSSKPALVETMFGPITESEPQKPIEPESEQRPDWW